MSQESKPFRVVVVEDDDDHAELAIFHLQQCAPDVEIVRLVDGQQAVDYLERVVSDAANSAPDLVLLDLKLPLLDGIGVLQHIDQVPALASIPVVMMSTSNAERDKVAAYRSHVNSYTVKPPGFDGYRELMRAMVGYWRIHNRHPDMTR